MAYWWLVEPLDRDGRAEVDRLLAGAGDDEWDGDAELQDFRAAMTA